MSATVNDFRDFFRPDKGPTRFGARAQLEAAVSLFDATFKNHNIAVRLHAPR
ncbi:MAG: hypothetical protein WCI05_15520 [Myxococcales bacterium]